MIFKNQHAYTCDRSTETAIADVVNYIEANSLRGKGKHCITTFMDISGAYDNAPYMHITSSMRKYGAPDEFVRYYENYLHNRQTTIQIGNYKHTKNLVVGVSQGSILSCVAWIFYLNDLIVSNDKGPHRVKAYADDIAAQNSGPFLNQVVISATENARNICEWTNAHGLQINPTKCDVIKEVHLLERRQETPQPCKMRDMPPS